MTEIQSLLNTEFSFVNFKILQMNVVHRDLKLGNMVLDKRNRRIILTNFGLGCHLTNDRDLLTDQRGSPAYISPDVLSGNYISSKPSFSCLFVSP